MNPELLDFFLLRDSSIRTVVLGSILLGVGSAAIGCFALLRKRALVGDAVAHAVLPGVALAFMIVGTKDPLALMIGAIVTGWFSMVSMDYIVRKSRIREDAAIGLTLSVFFGLGILLLTHIQHSGSANQTGLDKFLFGQAASLLTKDVVIFGSVSLLLLLIILFSFKELKLISFDPDFTKAIGFPARFLELLMTTLLVLAVVVGIQAVGVVLMAAMLITPAAAARYWTERLGVMILLSSLFGIVSGYGGAFISYLEPKMPTGPWIVVVASLTFFFSLLVAPGRGVIARALRRRQNVRVTLAENILKTMHRIGEVDGNLQGERSLKEIQEYRMIPLATLRRGLARLVSDRYVQERVGDRWSLTPEGIARGARITRLHRLWEVYLTEYVRIAPDHVHDDAESIEHVLTPELERELEGLLNRPESDPHQQVIPYR
ncbi:MAG: metal ABC transporter permease [Ignavibacteriae bacterium]|nr:metal ABC transporter permease [Ignavibacteriota bacterium]MCB9216364.1 metal ABC transporter permease [Ignavibacteria bacterium]